MKTNLNSETIVANGSSSVFTTVVNKDTLMGMPKEERKHFLERALGQEEGKLNFASVIKAYVNGEDLDSVKVQVISEILKNHVRVAVMTKLLQNKEFICSVKDSNGKVAANRFMTHYDNKYIIFDDDTGLYVIFSSNHTTCNIQGIDVVLQNNRTGKELVIEGTKQITNGMTTEPFVTTGSREADALRFTWHTNDGTDEARCDKVNIKYANIIWGMTHGYEVLNTFKIFDIELCDLHHTLDYEEERFKYQIDGLYHPDRVSNLQLLPKAEHRALHKAEAEKKREEEEARQEAQREAQRIINMKKLLGENAVA